MLSKKFRLNPDCFLVKGASRGALYDLSSGNIYSIDASSMKILDNCEKDLVLSQIIEIVPEVCSQKITEYLNGLTELALGSFFETHQIVNKINLAPPEFKLDFLWLELTPNCNQECLHCYADSFPGKNKSDSKGFLDYEDWNRVIKEGYVLGCRRLQFTGGEPLLFGKKIFSLIKAARDIGYEQIELFTNSVLITEQDVNLLVEYDVHVGTNIYSRRPEVHDEITGLKGSFEKTIKNIKLMQKRGVKVYLATILMKQNEKYIEETVAFLEEMGNYMPLKYFDVVRPSGRGNNRDIHSEKLWPKKKNAIFSKITKEKFIQRKFGHSCWWGIAVVTCNGQVMPCIMASGTAYGDIKKQSLVDIIEGPGLQRLWKLSKDQIEICRDCEYRYACLDCRPMSMEQNCGLHNRGSNCLYDPYQGEWQQN